MNTFLRIPLIFLALALGLLTACSQNHVDYARIAQPYVKAFSAPMPFKGDYARQYKILNEPHTVAFSFTPTQGRVHTTGKLLKQNAVFTALGYDPQAKRWLGVSHAGSLFLVFWDDADPEHPKVYTRFLPLKNASKKTFVEHLQQAIALKRPAEQDNTFRGWNTLHAGQRAPLDDTLPYVGAFTAVSSQTHGHTPIVKAFTFTPDTLLLDGMTIKQLSYHAGDRRWVGQMGDRYALMFLNPRAEPDVFDISFALYDNHKYLYNAKPDEVRPRYWFTYKRTPVKQ